MTTPKKKKINVRTWLLTVGLLAVTTVAVAYWIAATDKFADTSERKAAYEVTAIDFIREFAANDTAANKKYTEKIITVTGTISELEAPDSATINVKFIDTTTGSFAIFAFQEQDLDEARKLKAGDLVSIKGSCSGGTYSEILEVVKIDFKRSALTKTITTK